MTIMGQLGNLESAGLVRVAQVEPDLEYLFRHALVQEAAYASLLENDRKQLHLSVGEAIEQLYPERLDDFAAVLARHFEKAGDDEHALTYFVRAADAALASYANKEAEMHFRRALELTCPADEQARLLTGLGEALYRQTRFDEAVEIWRDGIVLYNSEGDLDGMVRLYSRLARVTWHMGDLPGNQAICEEGMSFIDDGFESADFAMLIHETARSYYFNGVTDKALPLCKKALEIAERFQAVEVQADALATYGVMPQLSVDESLGALQKSVEIAKKFGFMEIAGRAYHNLGSMTNTYTTDLKLSRHYYLKAAEMGRIRGVPTEEMFSLRPAAEIDLVMGNLTSVEETLERFESLTQSIADPAAASRELAEVQANVWWMRGKWKESLELDREMYAQATESGNILMQISVGVSFINSLFELHRYGEMDDLSEAEALVEEIIQSSDKIAKGGFYTYCLLSILRSRQGRFDEAREALQKALTFAEAHPSQWNETIINEASAELAHREGHLDEAVKLYDSVVTSYKKIENRWSQARNLMDWAEVCSDLGGPAELEQARDLLREALIIFNEIGAHRHKKIVEERLQSLRKKVTARTETYQQDARELARAAQVQGSFLPENVPEIPGWELSVTLKPARQTSGDFYDFISLSGGKLGIVVADVADKGAAAALFMATCQSLIRTYAGEFIEHPEQVLAAASRRMLADTHAGLFVTVFYAVLDPETGSLVYCNAGHTPAVYLSETTKYETIPRTGPPLGVFEDVNWEGGEIRLNPGDSLVLYSDGVTDAQNSAEEFFGEKGLLISLKNGRNGSAEKLRDAILADVHRFVGDASQFDDITLMILTRNNMILEGDS